MSVDSLIGQSSALARLLVECAERFARRNRWTDSRALYSAAIKADPTPASRIAFGVCLADCERDEEAISQLELAWEEAKLQQMPMARAVCCHNLSHIYQRRDNLARSNQYQQLALAAEMDSQQFSETAELSHAALIQSAGCLSNGKELESALRLLDSAMEMSKDDPSARATIESNIGVTLARLGHLRQALLRLIRAHRFHREANELAECANDMLNIGHLMQACCRRGQALRCFQLAGDLYRQMHAQRRVEIAKQYAREVELIERIETFDHSRN